MNVASPEAGRSIRFVARADPAFVLTLAPQRATLCGGATGLQFEGEQALRAGDEACLFGRCTGLGGRALGLATLQVAPLPDGDDRGLCVTLRDAAGRVLLGPAVLQREVTATPRMEKPAWPRPSLTDAPAAWPAATR